MFEFGVNLGLELSLEQMTANDRVRREFMLGLGLGLG